MNVEELIERSHRMAVEKGWWPDGPEGRSVTDQVNNFHAEVSEAWEEWRAGRIETWWHRRDDHGIDREQKWDPHYFRPNEMIAGGWKPEGFWIEIADLCIRLADTMGAHGWRSDDIAMETYKQVPLQVLVKSLRKITDDMDDDDPYLDEWKKEAGYFALLAIQSAGYVASQYGVDLLALCELKMEYNATRPIRHGGKRA